MEKPPSVEDIRALAQVISGALRGKSNVGVVCTKIVAADAFARAVLQSMRMLHANTPIINLRWTMLTSLFRCRIFHSHCRASPRSTR